MSDIILYPPRSESAVWGTLAHVSAEERKRLLNLPSGKFKPAVQRLEKLVKKLIKEDEKRQKAERATA